MASSPRVLVQCCQFSNSLFRHPLYNPKGTNLENAYDHEHHVMLTNYEANMVDPSLPKQRTDMQITSTGHFPKSYEQLLFLEKGYQHCLSLSVVNKLPAVSSKCTTDVQSATQQRKKGYSQVLSFFPLDCCITGSNK